VRWRARADRALRHGLRRVGAQDLDSAKVYLEQVFLPLWNERFICAPQMAGDAHRVLPRETNLDSVLSTRESRTLSLDYTLRWRGAIYRVPRAQIAPHAALLASRSYPPLSKAELSTWR